MIALKFLPVILSGLCWVFVFGGGYWMGCNATKQKYTIEDQAKEIEYHNKVNALVDQIRSQEIANQNRINDIMANHVVSEEAIRNEYEKIIEDLRSDKLVIANSLHLSKDCSASKPVSSTADNSSELVCFSKRELYAKIERSMAIASEADRLAEKYNALLAVCKQK